MWIPDQMDNLEMVLSLGQNMGIQLYVYALTTLKETECDPSVVRARSATGHRSGLFRCASSRTPPLHRPLATDCALRTSAFRITASLLMPLCISIILLRI